MGNSTQGRSEIQITNVDPKLKEDLQLIVRNKGITLTGLLRPVLENVRNENKQYIKEFKD